MSAIIPASRALALPTTALLAMYVVVSFVYRDWVNAVFILPSAACAIWAGARLTRFARLPPYLGALGAVPIAVVHFVFGGWLSGALVSPDSAFPTLKAYAGCFGVLYSLPITLLLGWCGARFQKKQK